MGMFSGDFGLGTLISNASNLWGTGSRLAEKREKDRRDRSMWDAEFARQQMGLDYMSRVEAAKAAGIHPLIAFGSGGVGGGSSPVVSDSSPMPQMSFSSGGKEDPDLRRLRAAQADMAELQVADARRRLAGQPGNQGGGVMVGDQWQEQPASITSVARGIPYQQAGPAASTEQLFAARNPITGETQYGNLPGADVGEKIENMGEFWQAILMTPMAGRFLWDAMMPDRAKNALFRFMDRLGETARARTAPERGRGASGSW